MDGFSVDREALLTALQNVVHESAGNDGAICTTFILISEWMGSDGKYYSLVVTDEQSPPWRHEGLINYALANEIYSSDEEEEEPDA